MRHLREWKESVGNVHFDEVAFANKLLKMCILQLLCSQKYTCPALLGCCLAHLEHEPMMNRMPVVWESVADEFMPLAKERFGITW